MKYIGETDYDHKGLSPRSGVLLCNLGTPDKPSSSKLRSYLKQFLSDPRVVEVPRIIWWLVLNLIILTIRPRRSAKLYQTVWTEDGSPLLVNSLSQTEKLKIALEKKYNYEIPVELGMRYGNPSIHSAIEKLTSQNVRNITVLPLYPQYSGATTGTTFDAIADVFKKTRWVPELHFVGGYHQSSKFIRALVKTIENQLKKSGNPDMIIMSYHGTPERYLKNGDPYHCFCHQTTRLVSEALHFESDKIITTFQSRFGREPWLQPYTDETIESLPPKNIKKIFIICPGFSSDCLETLEEINGEAREIFLEAGGEEFEYISCLNDDNDHIEVLVDIVSPYLSVN